MTQPEFTPLAPHTYVSGLRVVLVGANLVRYPVTTGQLDADAVKAYLHGQCHALAEAISRATGWHRAVLITKTCGCKRPYVAPCGAMTVEENVRACQLEHVMTVRPYDRAFVDITGAWSADSVERGRRVVPMTATLAESIAADRAWPAPNVEVARTFVGPLLNSLASPDGPEPQAPPGPRGPRPPLVTVRGCLCCCTACDRGYVRDAVFDRDTQRAVPADHLCDHRKPGARRCDRCQKCDPVLGRVCST